MDSEEEEFLPFSDTDRSPSSPAPERKLKRLRKAGSKKAPIDLPSVLSNAGELRVTNAVDSPNFEALDEGENDCGGLKEPDARSVSQLEGLREGFELDTGSFDGLDREESGPALDFDSVVEEFHGVDGDRSYDMEVEDAREDFRMDEGSEEKQNDLDFGGLDEGKGKTEKKRGKRKKRASDGFNEEPFSAALNQKMTAKERRDHLKQLRVDSQRLLRETRDASFKPAPLVQKPISAVLEKIRKRKLEVSKRSITTNSSSLFDYNGVSEFDLRSVYVEETESDYVEIIKNPVETDSMLDSLSADGFEGSADHIHKHKTSEEASAEKSVIKFRAPVDDTQDLIFDSQKSDSKDELPDETPSSPLEEVFAPSLLAMNLKLDSAPPDESSDEDDEDKENIEPHLHGSVDLSSSPKGDPVKAFVDEEAEEEDDSDNDLGRFQDDEEDEDNLDLQELNEMIATEYEEKPIENEMRNQLHQKWLEQQDAAGTEHLLQRLKCGSKQREPSLPDERDDDVSEEDQGEFFDTTMDSLPRSVVRMNLKKAKEMICQMFTDKDDVYISSDDEEAEKRLVTQALSDKPEDQANFLSPAEDEGSKEIFSLIKKLNGVPDTRKKTKATSHFHMLSVGGNRTTSSKSSFLGRGSKSSLPSLNKHASSTVRSFVFERDDSRSTISMPEECSESIHTERRPTKIASAKFCKSQIRSSTQNTQTAAAMNTGPSLHEILRCSSLQSSHCNGDGVASKVDAIYTAFKLDKNIVKREPSVSVRAV